MIAKCFPEAFQDGFSVQIEQTRAELELMPNIWPGICSKWPVPFPMVDEGLKRLKQGGVLKPSSNTFSPLPFQPL